CSCRLRPIADHSNGMIYTIYGDTGRQVERSRGSPRACGGSNRSTDFAYGRERTATDFKKFNGIRACLRDRQDTQGRIKVHRTRIRARWDAACSRDDCGCLGGIVREDRHVGYRWIAGCWGRASIAGHIERIEARIAWIDIVGGKRGKQLTGRGTNWIREKDRIGRGLKKDGSRVAIWSEIAAVDGYRKVL